jgi:hypothetical protein
MHLTNDQVRRLVQLLNPHFQSRTQRQTVLGQVFRDNPALAEAVNLDGSPDEFTTSLIHSLNDGRLSAGSRATPLLQLLTALQKSVPSPEFVAAVQPFILTLNAPDPRDGPTPQVAAHPAQTKRRALKRRHRSPARRALHRFSRLLRWRIVLVIVLIATIVPAASFLVIATDASSRVQESLSNIKRVTSTLANRSFTQITLADFQRLQASVQDLSKSLDNARQQAGLLQRFSSLNPALETNFDILSGAEQVALAAQNILDGLQPVLFFLVGGQGEQPLSAQISSGERLIELLRIGQGKFLTARDQLEAAQNTISALNLNGLSPELLLQIQELSQYHAQLTKIDQFLVEGPDLLATVFGVDAPRNYLVLAQNSDELRPSGGYISTYGWMRVRRFRITDYAYSPTTPLSPNPPPAEMAGNVNVPDWWIQYSRPIYAAWDGSWYADFPSTAKMAAWYYDNGQNPRSPVNGVIAIDLLGFEKILEGLGSVTVPDYNEVITVQNFRDVVYRIRAEREGHKEFLAAAYKQIFANWQTVDERRSVPLLNAVLSALQEKHIMIYFTDARLNEFMDLLGWSGAQTPGNYDYLMIADANLGNKSNHSILRSVTYDAAIQTDGSLKSRTAISYDYSASLAEKDPAVRPEHYGNQKDYANLLQVFIPKGAVLTGTDNLASSPKTVNIANLTSLVDTVNVKFDSTERYLFSYTTPRLVEPFGPYRRYRLLLQKQPGTPGDAVSVQVSLPAGATLISASPAAAASYTLDNPILEFRLQLQIDQWIEIIFK